MSAPFQTALKTSIKEVPWTPVLVQPQGALPQMFTAGDGKTSVAYDLLLLNYNSVPADVERLEVLDELGNVVRAFAGSELEQRVQQLSGRANGLRLSPGSCATIFIDLSFEKQSSVPAILSHRLSFVQNIQSQPHQFVYEAAALAVDKRAPAVIGPPLAGAKWCLSTRGKGGSPYRWSLLPVNNRLQSAQLFATDWERCGSENAETFGQPVLAVADGTALGVIDRFSDDHDGAPDGAQNRFYPEGNAILEDIGGGRYVLYSQLKSGSIKVKEGQRLRRGQEIAQVGNSGDSSRPHLHLQVMDAPDVSAANGLPYVISTYNVLGVYDAAGNVVPSPRTGEHKNSLPEQGEAVEFPKPPVAVK